jgi:NTE family protein
MRATMSLPLIFPPTEVNGQVLIDGGTMDNVPADVVKAMGATRVIAVNVGDLADARGSATPCSAWPPTRWTR